MEQETYSLLPDLEKRFGSLFAPELTEISMFIKEERVWIRWTTSIPTGEISEDIDLSFIKSESHEPLFSASEGLVKNVSQFLELDKLSIAMTLGELLTKEGEEKLIGE
jgi:hypothetical protein